MTANDEGESIMKRKKRWLLISLMAAASFCVGGCSPEKKAIENGIEIGSEETLDEELTPDRKSVV